MPVKTVAELEKELEAVSKERDTAKSKVESLEKELDDAIYQAEDSLEESDESSSDTEEGDDSSTEEENSDNTEELAEKKKKKGEKEEKEEKKPMFKKNSQKKASDGFSNKLEEANTKIKVLEDHIGNLLKVGKEYKNTILSNKKENILSQLKTQGCYPATIKVVEQLLSEDDGSVILKLNEETKDGTVEHQLTLSDAIVRILNSIPEEGRFKETPNKTHSDQKKLDNKMEYEDEPDKVEAFAKEKNISYSDALLELNRLKKL